MALSQADGTYALPQLPNGTYDLSVVLDGYVSAVQISVVVTSAGATTVNFSLTASTSSLSGAALDPSGNPIADASVQVFDAAGRVVTTTTTAADGSFTVNTAVGAGLKLVLDQTGYAPLTVSNINGASGASVNLGTLNPTAVADPLPPLVQLTNPIAAATNAWYKEMMALAEQAKIQAKNAD